MKNQKGVTLIALVITIIVLLILAAASIATLTGDNGIFSNAQNARAENTKSEVREKYLLAYNTIRTQVLAKSVTDGNYHSNTAANSLELALLALQDITGQKQTTVGASYKVGSGTYAIAWTAGSNTDTNTAETSKAILEVTYTDSVFKDNGKITSLNKTTYPIKCTITIQDNICNIVMNNDGYGTTATYGDTIS